MQNKKPTDWLSLPQIPIMPPLESAEPEAHVFSADNFARPLQCELDRVNLTTERNVHFAEQISVINHAATYSYTAEDVRTRWMTPHDLQAIRREVKMMSQQIRNESRAEHCYVSMAHRKTSLMLARDFRSLVKLSPHTPEEEMKRWNLQLDGRRGLERFASRDYAHMRKRDVQQVRSRVLEEQARQRVDGVYDDEAIAKASLSASRRSRTFASYVGAADASCLKAFRARPERNERFAAPARKRSKVEVFSLDELRATIH